MQSALDFRSLDDLDPEVIDRAFDEAGGSPREHVLKLVERMARVAKPGRGAHRLLEVLARLARSDWIEGPLDVVLRDFDLATEIEIRVDVGRRLERIRTLSVAVPLSELTDWVADNADVIQPLVAFDSRRDDELRLRRATPRVSTVPRSSVPLVNPVSSSPARSVRSSAPPASSARRPIAAASRSRSPRPPDAAGPPSSSGDAQAIRMTLADAEETQKLATESRDVPSADVHRRDTPRVMKLELPDEAYRQKPPMDRKATVRIPIVRPAPSAAEPDADPTDEGWE
jgi:hypothetical protein